MSNACRSEAEECGRIEERSTDRKTVAAESKENGNTNVDSFLSLGNKTTCTVERLEMKDDLRSNEGTCGSTYVFGVGEQNYGTKPDKQCSCPDANAKVLWRRGLAVELEGFVPMKRNTCILQFRNHIFKANCVVSDRVK